MKKFYITTPIYYVNDSPHIGHAYTTLACDVTARFHRLDGKHVLFLTGTDEHGQKVEKSAENAGTSPLAFCDNVSQRFRALATAMNFSNDDFIRTTEPRHKKAAQAFWNILKENGHIYLSSYAGWYAVRDEAFYAESELVDGKAPTGADVSWVEEPSYFFDLSTWQDTLLAYYEANPDFIAPASRRNEVISFVKGGLKDLSVSRTSFRWGIPVPDDEQHIMYVWLDALVNYLTATGFPDNDYKESWPADLHMVGKDILRFHAVYWPAFLMAANLPLPKKVFAHGWWTNEGQKISKSLGNVIDPHALISEFGLDQTRYFLLREVPFGSDGNFSKVRMIQTVNAELANNIGNLTQRTLSLIAKNCDGILPHAEAESFFNFDIDQLRKHIAEQSFQKALEMILGFASAANEYIDQKAPWSLKKQGDVKGMEQVLYSLCEAIRQIAILLQPFIPDSAAKILQQLGLGSDPMPFSALSTKLKSGTSLPAPQGIFPRLESKE